MDFGVRIRARLNNPTSLSELSWNKKYFNKKMFRVGDEIDCVITEIDKEKRRIAISHRLTQENP